MWLHWGITVWWHHSNYLSNNRKNFLLPFGILAGWKRHKVCCLFDFLLWVICQVAWYWCQIGSLSGDSCGKSLKWRLWCLGWVGWHSSLQRSVTSQMGKYKNVRDIGILLTIAEGLLSIWNFPLNFLNISLIEDIANTVIGNSIQYYLLPYRLMSSDVGKTRHTVFGCIV